MQHLDDWNVLNLSSLYYLRSLEWRAPQRNHLISPVHKTIANPDEPKFPCQHILKLFRQDESARRRLFIYKIQQKYKVGQKFQNINNFQQQAPVVLDSFCVYSKIVINRLNEIQNRIRIEQRLFFVWFPILRKNLDSMAKIPIVPSDWKSLAFWENPENPKRTFDN